MKKYTVFDPFPLREKDNDFFSNYEQSINIDYYEPSLFLNKNLEELDNNIDDIEKRIYYKEQKDLPKNLSKDEQNKKKCDLFPFNISGKNKNEEINNLKKLEETSPTSEKTEPKLTQEKKIEMKTEKNVNNNDTKKINITLLCKKRNRKNGTNGNNSNLKRVRKMILNSIKRFINKKIKKVFNNNIGRGIVSKQFVNISQVDLTHSSVEFDKNYLYGKLKDIFSDNISGKYTNFLKNKNQELVTELINLENYGDYFDSLFELKFLDCIEHINGIKNISLLDGFESVDEIIINEKDDLDLVDINNYKETIKHYKEYIENKNSRRSRKNID